MLALTPASIQIGLNLKVPKCVFTPTQPPTTRNKLDLSELQENNSAPSRSSKLSLTAIPLGVAEFLLNTYISRVVPQYPIYPVADVVRSFKAIYHRPATFRALTSEPSLHDTYTVSLIMAISLCTSARHKQVRAQSLATALFQTAIQHAAEMWSNDLSGLQALILAMQYVFLNPQVANLTILSGFACEACIDMGLHHEPPLDSGLTAQQLELRRLVFWCAWEMEVAVAACVRRPPRIENRIISTSLPFELNDLTSPPSRLGTTDKSATFMAHRIWIYRKIESEIMSVLYTNHAGLEDSFDSGDPDSWLAGIETSIEQWLQEINSAAELNEDPSKQSSWEEMKLYGNIAYNYTLVCLFGPCPRLPTRSRSDMLKCLAASVCVASGYTDQANSAGGYLKYLFHPCYHTFSSGMLFLTILKDFKGAISGSHTVIDVEYSLDCFRTLLSTMAERWPAVSRCQQEFESLSQSVKDDYTDFIFERTSSSDQRTNPQDSWQAIIDNPMVEGIYGGFNDVPYDWNLEFGFGIEGPNIG